MRDDERCGRSREVRTSEMIGQINDFMNRDRRVSIETLSAQFNVSVGAVHIESGPELFESGQWHQESSLQPGPCSLRLLAIPKAKEDLRGNIPQLTKEAVTRNTLTQEEGGFPELLERYKSIDVAGEYFEVEFFVCTVNKSIIPKKQASWLLLNNPYEAALN